MLINFLIRFCHPLTAISKFHRQQLGRNFYQAVLHRPPEPASVTGQVVFARKADFRGLARSSL
jgi:hypothetical protein